MSNVTGKSPADATPNAGGTDQQTNDHSGSEIMQAVLSRPRNTAREKDAGENRLDGVVIGTLTGTDEDPTVHYPGLAEGETLKAVTLQPLSPQQQGREVALSFINGDPVRPVIIGLIQNIGNQEKVQPTDDIDVCLDGEKLTMTAEKEIVLKCGEASITLTRAGKIIIKGAYLSNHSKGVNRIKGGSVQIN